MSYELKVRKQIADWEQKFLKPPGFFERTSNKLSHKINQWIPQKIHNAITLAVKSIVRTTLFGAEYIPKGKAETELSLEQADEKAWETISLYQKIAAAEGAGTGAGGILLSAVDFPALIAIKMKFLFELAHVYGFNTKVFSERIFILSTFQLAFSGENQRSIILKSIKDWDDYKQAWSSDSAYYKDMDWETFQQDYRDSIDFRKMLQFIPGIGAIAGAWANYSIVEDLGAAGMNCYRIRRLSQASL